jgi:hypothetical protein
MAKILIEIDSDFLEEANKIFKDKLGLEFDDLFSQASDLIKIVPVFPDVGDFIAPDSRNDSSSSESNASWDLFRHLFRDILLLVTRRKFFNEIVSCFCVPVDWDSLNKLSSIQFYERTKKYFVSSIVNDKHLKENYNNYTAEFQRISKEIFERQQNN